MTTIRADYFGAASFSSIMGISAIIVMIGRDGPIVAGVLYDTTGSYVRVQILAAVARGRSSSSPRPAGGAAHLPGPPTVARRD
jgi:hypothetical protein